MIAGMTNFDLQQLDRGVDPLKTGNSAGFSSIVSANNRRVDYNPTKVGPTFTSKMSQPSMGGLLSQNSGLANQMLNPMATSIDQQMNHGKSISIGKNHEFENKTTHHNTSLQQESKDFLMGPSIESTIMAGLR
jgi:hypothetical protein